jgi:hypothetical protein
MENNAMSMPQDNMAEAGRGTDNVMAHMSLGEVVIPRAFLDDPQVMQALQMIFQAAGADINEFTVGHEANKINPETGYPEFGFKKFFKKIAPYAGLALALVPGLQGVGLGLGTALGATGAGASALGGGLIGGGLGYASGGLKGALKGAALGGAGGYLSGGGFSNMFPETSSSLFDSTGGLLGSNGLSAAENGFLSSARTASGAGSNGISGLVGNLGGGSSLSGLSAVANVAGGFQQDAALKKQKEQLLAAQGQQLNNLDNLNPVDVQNDPGYQFNLAQGQEALNRSLGAQGGLFSGAALKAASQYNQDYANNYYNQAYGRQATKVGAQNDIYGNRGNILGNATLARSNNINQSLANAVGGNVGNYGGQGGGFTNEQLLALMRQRGLM